LSRGGESCVMADSEETANDNKRKAKSAPPDGYVCRLCNIPGHWIQVCPTKKTGAKRRRKSDHVPVPGKDPSPEDIEYARKLQEIPPPKCFCGLPSRLNKVKQSKAGGDKSRAIGKYFFFCSKKRDDDAQCRYARPMEMELNKKKSGGRERTKGKTSGAAAARHDGQKREETKTTRQVCKFFAKNGGCKKGDTCNFSHDVPSKKEPARAKKELVEAVPKKNNGSATLENADEEHVDGRSSSDSGSSDSDSSASDSSDSDSSDGGSSGSNKSNGGSGDSSSSSDISHQNAGD